LFFFHSCIYIPSHSQKLKYGIDNWSVPPTIIQVYACHYTHCRVLTL
jgi:hypothetical protein